MSESPKTKNKLNAPDDAHYAKLPIQPIEISEQMVDFWPKHVIYHLTESMAAIMRVGSKGGANQWSRDLRKAAWFLSRAADVVDKIYIDIQSTPEKQSEAKINLYAGSIDYEQEKEHRKLMEEVRIKRGRHND